jgi:hypothetical protein
MRWFCGFLAMVYLALAVETPVWAQAQQSPVAVAIQVDSHDYPCAHHQCGCQSREQCLLHCCCKDKHAKHMGHAKPPVQAAEQKPVRASFLAALACRGEEPVASFTAGRTLGPHLPPAIAHPDSPLAPIFRLPVPFVPIDSHPAEAPEKVPILV